MSIGADEKELNEYVRDKMKAHGIKNLRPGSHTFRSLLHKMEQKGATYEQVRDILDDLPNKYLESGRTFTRDDALEALAASSLAPASASAPAPAPAQPDVAISSGEEEPAESSSDFYPREPGRQAEESDASQESRPSLPSRPPPPVPATPSQKKRIQPELISPFPPLPGQTSAKKRLPLTPVTQESLSPAAQQMLQSSQSPPTAEEIRASGGMAVGRAGGFGSPDPLFMQQLQQVAPNQAPEQEPTEGDDVQRPEARSEEESITSASEFPSESSYSQGAAYAKLMQDLAENEKLLEANEANEEGLMDTFRAAAAALQENPGDKALNAAYEDIQDVLLKSQQEHMGLMQMQRKLQQQAQLFAADVSSMSGTDLTKSGRDDQLNSEGEAESKAPEFLQPQDSALSSNGGSNVNAANLGNVEQSQQQSQQMSQAGSTGSVPQQGQPSAGGTPAQGQPTAQGQPPAQVPSAQGSPTQGQPPDQAMPMAGEPSEEGSTPPMAGESLPGRRKATAPWPAVHREICRFLFKAADYAKLERNLEADAMGMPRVSRRAAGNRKPARMYAINQRIIANYGRAWGMKRPFYGPNASPDKILLEYLELHQILRAYQRYTSGCESQYTQKAQSIRELINQAARKASSSMSAGVGQQLPGQAAQASQSGKLAPGGPVNQAAAATAKQGQAAGALGSRGVNAMHGSAIEGMQDLYGLDPSPIDPIKTLRGSKTSQFMFAPYDSRKTAIGAPAEVFRVKTILGKRERQLQENRKASVNQRRRLSIKGF